MRNRLIGAALGLAIAAIVIIGQERATQPASWDLLPENEGAIKSVAIQYSHSSAPLLMPCWRSFLEQAAPSVEALIVCGSRDEESEFRQMARSWKLAKPGRIRTLVVGSQITGWCKDRFLVAGSRENVLVVPKGEETGIPGRTNDSLVAPTIVRSNPRRFRVATAPLKFDAGDILATRSHVIVSDTLWRKNGRPADFAGIIERSFGRKVIWLHNVPDHHIGMFAAPLDDATVLVGDPSLAKPLWTPRMDSGLGRADWSKQATSPFDRAAEQLAKAGLEVVRVPTAVLGTKVYVSYTNGVFETIGKKRIVYMPSYGEPALDKAAKAIYEKESWQVRPIPVRDVFHFRGTIGCLINVMERN